MQLLNTLLKHLSLNKAVTKKTRLAFILFALLTINLSCGKRRSPLPPIERVSQRVEISGFQRGRQINLRWVMPSRNVSNSSSLNIDRVDVYRLAQSTYSPLTLSEEEFSSRSTLIATIPVSEKEFGLKDLNFTDFLEFTGQSVRLRYAIRFVNASGQKAAFSNFLLFDPTANVASEPQLLSIRSTESSNVLVWNAPTANINGSMPVNIIGYNIYRSTSETETAELLNQTPIRDTKYSDDNFSFGKNYIYFVRAVSLGVDSEFIESGESNIVRILPKDNFPPSSPSAITIAAAPNNLSIFFASNPEKDIQGYKIYRSNSREIPLSQWEVITPQILTVNIFQDTRVESGKTYYYYLVAVDKAGNVSEPSETVSETAP